MVEKMTTEGRGEKKKKNTVYMEVKRRMTDVAWKQQMLEGQEAMEEMMEEQVDLMRELVEIFRKWPERTVKLEELDSGSEEEDKQTEGMDKGKGKEKETDRVEEDGEGGDAGPLSSV
jgi:hypothetical protein